MTTTAAGTSVLAQTRSVAAALAAVAATLAVSPGAPASAQPPSLSTSYLVVTERTSQSVQRFDPVSGVKHDSFAVNLGAVESIVFGPDQNLYVSAHQPGRVDRYNGSTGAFIDHFVPTSPGLIQPEGLAFGPDGNLYVASFHSSQNAVHRYDGATGAFIDSFVSKGSGGLDGPVGIAFGLDGDLYVASQRNSQVLKYDGQTGAFLDLFVPLGSGGLSFPFDLIFGPDGHLYVSSAGNDRVLRYNGETGDFIDTFVAAQSGGLERPTGMGFGPDGDFYVASAFQSLPGSKIGVLRYDGETGAFLGDFVLGLLGPTDLLFYTFESQVAETGSNPDLALAPDGDRIVVWAEDQPARVVAQIFDSAGNPKAPPFAVSRSARAGEVESVSSPAVGADIFGDFFVVWTEGDGDDQTADDRVMGRAFDSDGEPQTSEVDLDGAGGGSETPDVAATAGVGFQVVWAKPQGGSGMDVLRRTVGPSGQPMGAVTRVNAQTTGDQIEPTISADGEGDFIVAWTEVRAAGPSSGLPARIEGPTQEGVSARMFGAGGAPASGDIPVAPISAQAPASSPAVGADIFGDFFVVAWTEPGEDTGDQDVVAQRFDASGQPEGTEIDVNANVDDGDQSAPSVSVNTGGDFAVAWQSENASGGTAVHGRSFGRDGVGEKTEFLVVDSVDSSQFGPPAITLSDGGERTVATAKRSAGGQADGVFTRALPRAFADTCLASDTILCLDEGRFDVRAEWRTSNGTQGTGHAVALTRDTGYFWFFNAANVEIVLKVLDACVLPGHRFWVFSTGLTNVEVTLRVTDLFAGETVVYQNPLNRPFEPILDTAAFDTCSVQRAGDPSALAPRASPLFLNQNRFQVDVTWRTQQGAVGEGQPVKLTGDTGYFWFFNPENVEMVIKVLDACGTPSNRFWVFAAGLTDVEVDLTVRDGQTGQTRVYHNAQKTPFSPIQDTQAFPCP